MINEFLATKEKLIDLSENATEKIDKIKDLIEILESKISDIDTEIYELPESEAEYLSDEGKNKIGSEYVVEQFRYCNTLLEFQNKFREIESLSFTFM